MGGGGIASPCEAARTDRTVPAASVTPTGDGGRFVTAGVMQVHTYPADDRPDVGFLVDGTLAGRHAGALLSAGLMASQTPTRWRLAGH